MTSQSNTPAPLIAPTAPRPGSLAHLGGLDGLRAIAVIAVVVFHVVPGAAPGGGIGVDIFFVISGFLITGLLLEERADTGRIRLRSFWARRARRLLPALALLVLVCTSAAAAIGGDILVGMGRQVLGAATFSSNWLAIANGSSYFSGTTQEIFRNLWSLSVEEQFYLVWPFVVLLVWLVRWRWVRFGIFAAVAAASAVEMMLLYSPKVDPTRIYYGTDTHSFGLALGAALAVATTGLSRAPLEWPKWPRRILPLIGAAAVLGLIGFAVVVPSESAFNFQGGLAVVALLSALAILGAIIPASWLGTALDTLPLRWVGARSYGIYLWHWPVLALVSASAPKWQDAPTTEWLVGLVTIVITIAASTLSFQFIERPIRRIGLRAWLRRVWVGNHRAMRIAAGAVAVILVLAGIGGTAAAIVRAPLTDSAQSDVDAGKLVLAKAKYLPPPTPRALGSNMYAIGDSVMLASAPELLHDYPGMAINAVVSRQMNVLPSIVHQLLAKNDLRSILIVGLGTNGPIARSTLEEVLQMLGPNREMVLVNVEEPRSWEGEVNSTLAHFANDYESVELSDWYDAIKPHIDVLARDQIHPGGAGGRIYTAALKAALGRLAALPPYPSVSDFFSTTPIKPKRP
ncbi:MAG TPA: acyltransferase family protein [Galbitalea sp.]|jgi:peptidoglycan/LPS O-acetylase OafA/YrhL|nr:acyltransferase family protein [Galbitalea sp.]